MDETPVYFDMPGSRTIERKGKKEVRVRSTGAEKRQFTAVLTSTAAGVMLPPMIIFVTGSTKTVLIPQDRKFDFFSQTQSLMNVLSSFTATVDQSKVVCFCWLLFLKHSGEPYEWSGVLMEPWPTRRWLCVVVQLRGAGQ